MRRYLPRWPDVIYGSVCSGIEAATVAWHSLGWRPAFFSEIDNFPRAVLAHHYPEVPLHGDFTTIEAGQYPAIDLLVGGTPCQSFSVAGLRAGLDDPRGNLMLEFGALARRLAPKWLVWENVPGVLSSHGGRDFGTFLGMLGLLGYGFAYRVLDAQFFGVAQRRRRVFVVGCAGDWRRAAAVLFERHSLLWHSAPRREARQRPAHDTAPCLTSSGRGVERTGDTRGQDPVVAVAFGGNNQSGPIDVATARNACASASGRMDSETETFLVNPVVSTLDASYSRLQGCSGQDANHGHSHLVPSVSHSLRGEGFDASEDGTGRGTPLVPVAFAQNQRDEVRTMDVAGALAAEPGAKQQTYIAFSSKDHGADAGEIAPTLRSMGHDGSHANGGGQVAVAVALRGRESGATAEMGDEVGHALRASSGGGDKAHVLTAMQVRRLTPMECERLQGFPDYYTLIPVRGKPAADGPRYKALGNSMAVPVMAWIGRRIAEVDAIHSSKFKSIQQQCSRGVA